MYECPLGTKFFCLPDPSSSIIIFHFQIIGCIISSVADLSCLATMPGFLPLRKQTVIWKKELSNVCKCIPWEDQDFDGRTRHRRVGGEMEQTQNTWRFGGSLYVRSEVCLWLLASLNHFGQMTDLSARSVTY